MRYLVHYVVYSVLACSIANTFDGGHFPALTNGWFHFAAASTHTVSLPSVTT